MKSSGNALVIAYSIKMKFLLLFTDLTEVWRTRPERNMSGVVRGMAESSVPVGSWLWRGNPAGMNCCGDRLHSLECEAVLSL